MHTSPGHRVRWSLVILVSSATFGWLMRGPERDPHVDQASNVEVRRENLDRASASDRAAPRQNRDVATYCVERQALTSTIQLVGEVTYDESRSHTIKTRVPGRLVGLFADFPGVSVRKGDKLVRLCSPALHTAAEELLAIQQAHHVAGAHTEFLRSARKVALDSARAKLKHLGLSAAQILEIEKKGAAEDHLWIESPIDGVVVEKHQREGNRVGADAEIYRLADPDHLWVALEAKEHDLAWVRYGQRVEFVTEACPGNVFEGWIGHIDPTLDEVSRTVGVRVNVRNCDRQLKPGMLVHATIDTQIAASGAVTDQRLDGKCICPTHPEVLADDPCACGICGKQLIPAREMGYECCGSKPIHPLVIPASAVRHAGKRRVVFVATAAGAPTCYESREVVLGPRCGERFVVLRGLQEHERVVLNCNFKSGFTLHAHAGEIKKAPTAGKSQSGVPPAPVTQTSSLLLGGAVATR